MARNGKSSKGEKKAKKPAPARTGDSLERLGIFDAEFFTTVKGYKLTTKVDEFGNLVPWLAVTLEGPIVEAKVAQVAQVLAGVVGRDVTATLTAGAGTEDAAPRGLFDDVGASTAAADPDPADSLV